MTLELPRNPRILIVVLRRLGDVLLTTPLIRSLKRAYPDAAIDALVFAGTEDILAGNPDLANIKVMPQRPTIRETLALGARLWRRYHLAVSTQTGDRPTGLTPSSMRGRCSATSAGPKTAGARSPRRLLRAGSPWSRPADPRTPTGSISTACGAGSRRCGASTARSPGASLLR